MQTPIPAAPRRERRRPQISCTECRRRKQKCNKRADGPCTNCLRRYPPVQCFVQELEDPKVPPRQRPKRDTSDSRSSSSSYPRPAYPGIPLSRILHHPTHEVLTGRSSTPDNHLLQESVPVPGPVLIIDDDDDENENATELRLAQQNLKFTGPGSRDFIRVGSPRTIGGVLSMTNGFNDIPVETTLRNTELFHFFHNYVAPRLCSIDGGNIPPLFANEILPWQLKSPLMPNVAILMAAATQSHLHDCDSKSEAETLAMKSNVLKLVNRFIKQDFYVVGNQAMRIVIHLVVIEFFWGRPDNMWPHMYGIKQMLDLHGGFESMNDPLNMHVLIVTDYELACAFETDLVFQSMNSALDAPLPLLERYPARYRCPLVDYPVPFVDCREELSLTSTAAEILDNVRFLTLAISSCLLPSEVEPSKTAKIQSTASWLYKRLESMPEISISSDRSVEDLIFDTIRITALVYTEAIKSLKQMSHTFTPALKERLYTNMSLVGLTKWKDLPGVFLWILLVATPSADNDLRGRFLRKQMACTGMALGLDDFFRGTAYLRAFWVVQRWIDREAAEAVQSR